MTVGGVPVRLPFVGWLSIPKVRSSPSTSEPASVISFGVFSSVETDWAVAIGASLTGSTVMATVAGAESWVPSLAL